MKAGEQFSLCFEPNGQLYDALRSVHNPRIKRQLVGDRALMWSQTSLIVSPKLNTDIDQYGVEKDLRGVYPHAPGDWFQKGLRTPPVELPISYAYPENDRLALAVNMARSSLFMMTPAMRAIGLGKVLKTHANGDIVLHLTTSVDVADPTNELADFQTALATQRSGHRQQTFAAVFKQFVRVH